MTDRTKTIMAALAVATLAVAAGGCSQDTAPGDRPTVTVSIEPVAWLVERLAGEAVELRVALSPGESPASFDPTPRRLAALTGTDLYLSIGVPMERILFPHLLATSSDLVVADLTDGIDDLDGGTHAHHTETAHAHESHAGPDPHVWLSPRRMSVMASTAAQALAEAVPGQAEHIAARLDELQAELAALDTEVAALLAPAAGLEMVVFHPSFGYLAQDYGFRQTAIEKDGLPPTPRHLAEVLTGIREGGIRTVFVQPQTASVQLRAVAGAEGLTIETLDPLARDYIENLRRIAAAIGAALAPTADEVITP